MPKRHYLYEDKRDKASIDFMKKQARAEGITFGQWCEKYGIVSEWGEKKANREVPMSQLPHEMFHIDNRVSLQEWNDETPGGPKVASIIEDTSIHQSVRGPKRRRGRPVKKTMRVPNE